MGEVGSSNGHLLDADELWQGFLAGFLQAQKDGLFHIFEEFVDGLPLRVAGTQAGNLAYVESIFIPLYHNVELPLHLPFLKKAQRRDLMSALTSMLPVCYPIIYPFGFLEHVVEGELPEGLPGADRLGPSAVAAHRDIKRQDFNPNSQKNTREVTMPSDNRMKHNPPHVSRLTYYVSPTTSHVLGITEHAVVKTQ